MGFVKSNFRNRFNSGAIWFYFILLLVFIAFAFAIGGALLIQEFVIQVVLSFLGTVILIVLGRMFLTKKTGKSAIKKR